MNKEIEELKKRIEELENRPQYIPVYYPNFHIPYQTLLQPQIPQGFILCKKCNSIFVGYHDCPPNNINNSY